MNNVTKLQPRGDVITQAECAASRIARGRLRQPVLNAVRELAAEMSHILRKAGHEDFSDVFVECAAGVFERELADMVWDEIWPALGVEPPDPVPAPSWAYPDEDGAA